MEFSIIKASKPVCKIITNDKQGTGFFIKLCKDNKDFYCLMTNENLISKEMVNLKQTIKISYNNELEIKEIKLNEDERYIKDYKNMNIDIIIIEIIKKDEIKEKLFLLPYLGDNNILINKKINIIQYPRGCLSFSSGKILNIDKYEIIHDGNTDFGSSGSPIFLENTEFVVGIHKECSKEKRENYGDLLYPVIMDLKQQINYNNGDYYKGEIKGGKAYGKGILYYKNGNIKYEGDFINDKYEGNGKYYYENSEYYIGQWKNGLKHGKGIIYYQNGNIKYERDFINNELLK